MNSLIMMPHQKIRLMRHRANEGNADPSVRQGAQRFEQRGVELARTGIGHEIFALNIEAGRNIVCWHIRQAAKCQQRVYGGETIGAKASERDPTALQGAVNQGIDIAAFKRDEPYRQKQPRSWSEIRRL